MENFTEFDIHFETESTEPHKKPERDPTRDYADDIADLDQDKLADITRRSIEKKRIEQEEEVSLESLSRIEAKANEVAYNILEWVYLSAETGEWVFTYDMNRLDRMYLLPTVQALREYLPGVFMRVQDSSMNRWIEIRWDNGSK
ncbi:MAG: hypothetical protein ACTSX2_12840 [Candidatus Thorarchaeota archaeon]